MVVWGIQSKFKVSFLVRATLEKWAVWDLNAVPLDKAKNQESGDSRWQQSHLASAVVVCVYRWQERCLLFWFSGVTEFCACPYPFTSVPATHFTSAKKTCSCQLYMQTTRAVSLLPSVVTRFLIPCLIQRYRVQISYSPLFQSGSDQKRNLKFWLNTSYYH